MGRIEVRGRVLRRKVTVGERQAVSIKIAIEISKRCNILAEREAEDSRSKES